MFGSVANLFMRQTKNKKKSKEPGEEEEVEVEYNYNRFYQTRLNTCMLICLGIFACFYLVYEIESMYQCNGDTYQETKMTLDQNITIDSKEFEFRVDVIN